MGDWRTNKMFGAIDANPITASARPLLWELVANRSVPQASKARKTKAPKTPPAKATNPATAAEARIAKIDGFH